MRDHDWMRSRSRVEASAEADPAAMGPVAQRHEVYEHGLARNLTLHEDAQGLGTLVAMAQAAAIPSGLPGHLDRAVLGLDGALLDNCSENDATHQASIRRELQDRDRAVVEGVGLVMGFSPGRTFTLTGHPAADADGAYYVSRVVHSSRPRDAALGPRAELLRVELVAPPRRHDRDLRVRRPRRRTERAG